MVSGKVKFLIVDYPEEIDVRLTYLYVLRTYR